MSDNVCGTTVPLKEPSPTSEELLVAVLLTMLEANVESLRGMFLTCTAFPSPPGKSGDRLLETLASVSGEYSGLVARTKLEYFFEQFPGVAKILLGHATLPDIDVRNCFRKLIKKPEK